MNKVLKVEVSDYRIVGSPGSLLQYLFHELLELGFVKVDGYTMGEEGEIEKVILVDLRKGRCLTLALEEKRFFWAAELRAELAFFESKRNRSDEVWQVFNRRELILVGG